MAYRGHVENGVVVLDDYVELREGVQVVVELSDRVAGSAIATRLRGTPYRFEDPFSPAVPEKDWDTGG